jgi:hypothetical protein
MREPIGGAFLCTHGPTRDGCASQPWPLTGQCEALLQALTRLRGLDIRVHLVGTRNCRSFVWFAETGSKYYIIKKLNSFTLLMKTLEQGISGSLFRSSKAFGLGIF